LVSKLDDRNFEPLMVDRDAKSMIPLGFLDRVGLILSDSSGK